MWFSQYAVYRDNILPVSCHRYVGLSRVGIGGNKIQDNM